MPLLHCKPNTNYFESNTLYYLLDLELGWKEDRSPALLHVQEAVTGLEVLRLEDGAVMLLVLVI